MKSESVLKLDCHGMTIGDAMDFIKQYLWSLDSSGKTMCVITGTGKIRDNLVAFLNDPSAPMKFNWKFETNNTGCIIIQIPEWKEER